MLHIVLEFIVTQAEESHTITYATGRRSLPLPGKRFEYYLVLRLSLIPTVIRIRCRH